MTQRIVPTTKRTGKRVDPEVVARGLGATRMQVQTDESLSLQRISERIAQEREEREAKLKKAEAWRELKRAPWRSAPAPAADRIATALERIAVALEAIRDRMHDYRRGPPP